VTAVLVTCLVLLAVALATGLLPARHPADRSWP